MFDLAHVLFLVIAPVAMQQHFDKTRMYDIMMSESGIRLAQALSRSMTSVVHMVYA